MKKLISNLILILVAILIATTIIKIQKAQRSCNIDIEELQAGQHKAVYYQYLAYKEGRG